MNWQYSEKNEHMIWGSISVGAPSCAQISCIICRDHFLENMAKALCIILQYRQRKGSKRVVLSWGRSHASNGWSENCIWSPRIWDSRSSLFLINFQGICRIFVSPVHISKLKICPKTPPDSHNHSSTEASQHSTAITFATHYVIPWMQFRWYLLVKVNAGNHKAQLTARTVGRPKSG